MSLNANSKSYFQGEAKTFLFVNPQVFTEIQMVQVQVQKSFLSLRGNLLHN